MAQNITNLNNLKYSYITQGNLFDGVLFLQIRRLKAGHMFTNSGALFITENDLTIL